MSNVQRSQVTIPVGDQLNSIKEILEKVNLFSFPSNDEEKKSEDDVLLAPDPKDAYLGPKFWDKSITLDSLSEMDEPELCVMNFNEFLIENNLTMSETDSVDNPIIEEEEEEEGSINSNQQGSSPKRMNPSGNKKKRPFNEESNTSFLYVESKRARLEREAEERARKKKEEEDNLEASFDPKELSLATIPGSSFDPRRCAFSSEDLKPQPIIRKRKKDFVPSDKKDYNYWEKRKRNNQSARRSREARRLKENQIALRASFLEKENAKLRIGNKELKEENLNLKDTISFLRDKLSTLTK